MIKINPSILSKTVKAITPKTEKVEEAQIRGTIVFHNQEHFVQLDGAPSNALTPIANFAEGASDAGFVHGDRVLVLIKNHQAIVTKNLTTGLQAQAAKEASTFTTAITDEGITAQRIIANDTFTNTLRANNITADEIIAGMATIDTLDANYAHITNGVIDNAKIGVADVNDLSANYAHITTGVIDNAKIDVADVNNLSANYAHITNGVIDNAKIGVADVNNLSANYAQIDAANVTDLSAQNAWVNKIMVQTGLIAHEGTVFTLDAIQVNAANITAGTIDVNRLIVTVDGEKYLVEIDPTTHQPSYEKLDGGIVEPRTITADKIVAHDITVQEITTENLVGTNGWINLNLGRFFYGNGANYASSTNAIDWNGTTLKIKGDIGDSVVFNNYSTTTEMSTAIGNAVDGIEVGGRNLVRNTATGNGIDLPPNCTIAYENGELYYKWEQTNQNWNVLRFRPYFPIEFVKGKKITVSAEVRGFNLPSTTVGSWFYINPTCLESQSVAQRNRYQNHAFPSSTLTNNTWVKVSYTIDVPTDFSSWSYELTTNPNYMTIFLYNYSGTRVDFRRVKLEVGNKGTDWSPAPEDVSSIKTLTSANASGATYATILGYAAEGTSNNYTVTSTVGIKAGDTVRIAYKVSDMGTASNRPYVYIIGEVTDVNDATNVRIIAHGLGTTIIDGGNIITNSIGAEQIKARSIGASKLLVTDDTNLITVTELDANSLQNEMGTPRIENGYLIKNTATQAEMGLTPKQISNFKQNDEIYYEFRIKAAAEGAIRFGIWGYDANGSYISGSFSGNTITATTSEQFVSGYIKLASAAWTDTVKKYTIGINDDKTTKSQLYVRTAVARRKSAGELIVDGSITASKIKAGEITSDHISSSKISASKIKVDEINIGAAQITSGIIDNARIPNLSADKITSGTINVGRIPADALNSNVQVGGTNMLIDSINPVQWDFMTKSAVWTRSLIEGGASFSVTTAGASDSWGVLMHQDAKLRNKIVAGQQYNISFDIRYNATVDVSAACNIRDSDGTKPLLSDTAFTISFVANQWKHISVSYPAYSTLPTLSNQRLYISVPALARRTGVIGIRNVKVEVGNKGTDWSPAPEDIVNENLLIDSQKMTQWVANTRVSKNTSLEIGEVTLNGSNADWNCVIWSQPLLPVSILDGSPLWLSFEYTASATTSQFRPNLQGSASNAGEANTIRSRWKDMVITLPAASSWTKHSVRMPTTVAELTAGSGNVNSIYLGIYLYDNVTVKLRKLKLEHGKAPSTWSPSAEEFKTHITRIGDDGISIHAANNATLSQNYVILGAGGLNIYNQGSSVAYYGQTARIGKDNSKHASIDTNGFHVWDGVETTATNEIALFGSTARIGKSNSKRIELDSSNFAVIESNGIAQFSVDATSDSFTRTYTRYLDLTEGGYIASSRFVAPGVGASIKVGASSAILNVKSAITTTLTLPTTMNATTTVTANNVTFAVTKEGKYVYELNASAPSGTYYYAGYTYTTTFREALVSVNDSLINSQQHIFVPISVDVGVLDDCRIMTWGRIAQIYLEVHKSSVSSGSNIFEGVLTDFLPVDDALICGYYGGRACPGKIDSGGQITVRNAGSSSVSPTASSPLIVLGTYIFDPTRTAW